METTDATRENHRRAAAAGAAVAVAADASAVAAVAADAAAPTLRLADDWRAWVTTAHLEGNAPADIVAGLVAAGVPADLAAAEVEALLSSPAMAAAQDLAGRLARLQMVAALQRNVAAASPRKNQVSRRANLSADEFFEHYYARNQPVILTDLLVSWPAAKLWTPAYLKERLGAVPVDFTVGRASDPDCNRNFSRLTVREPMGSFIDRVLAAGTSDDLYMISNNRNMERPEVQALLGDLAPRTDLFDRRLDFGHVCLWVGPAGTVTPLHHDQNNNMFCQVYGRKRLRLAAPTETSLAETAEDFYSPADLERQDHGRFPWLADVTVLDVTLEAGEALFIPVGWWHQVRSLAVSINLSLMNFHRPNRYDWYKPGLIPFTSG